MGEYVPIPKFDDPGFALLQVIGLSVALGQLVMVLRLLRRLHECPNAGKSLLLLLCGVNLCSCLLQTSKSASMITYRYDHISVVDMMTFALAPPTFGGVMILQLDIRIVFDSLFPSGFCGTCGWSSKVKARARILIIALHVCLSLPDYLRIFGFVATIHRRMLLVSTFTYKALNPHFFLSRRVGQFAIICIGIEVITESVTLLNMLHLVCEKQLKSSVATESPDNIDSSEDFPTSIAIPGPPPGSLITTSSPLEMDHLGSQVNSMAFNLIRDNE
ncbi:hypothetical protein BSLG_003931 [Batrachochytrium salamandrivorans]|nr:hypothetical protein BSLG_003931 [Batrachochytrium salamandrivorans]